MNKFLEIKMKNKTILMVCTLIIIIIVISGCSNTSTQSASNSSNASEAATSNNLSTVNKLLVGSLKLEDTDQAISADEAVILLPLWQAYRSLSNSQTSAEAEVDALLTQIQNSMTPEQVQAITAMNLTSTDMMDLMQSMGGGMMGRGTPNPQSTPGADYAIGGFQGGNPPSGDFQTGSGGPPGGSSGGTTRNFPPGGAVIIGGGPGGDAGSAAGLGGGPALQGTPDPSMQATAQARFSTQANQVNPLLLDVLISKLEAETTK